MAPMLNAALTGSSWNGVPGTLGPLGTMVPSTIGPRSLVHSLNLRPSRPHPRVSRKTNRAVSNCDFVLAGRILENCRDGVTYSEIRVNRGVVDVRSNILDLWVVLSCDRRRGSTRLKFGHRGEAAGPEGGRGANGGVGEVDAVESLSTDGSSR